MFIVTAKEMYDMDRLAMQEFGLEGKLLMENAGRAVAFKVMEQISRNEKIGILAGAGNNGGDGFVIARTLLDHGYQVEVLQVVANEKITGDAYDHKVIYEKCGGKVTLYSGKSIQMLKEVDVLIDAMIGIGMNGEVREPFTTLISLINEQEAYVISVDIPSGVPADEGEDSINAVQADYTVIIGAPKQSAFLPNTASFYGEWDVVSIGLPTFMFHGLTNKTVWQLDNVEKTLPKRELFDHKGNHGKGLIIGGCKEMPGALSMSVQAALKSGAGLITGASSSPVIQMIAGNSVEAMYIPLMDTDGYLNNHSEVSFAIYDAAAIGMGLGRKKITQDFVAHVMNTATCPIIIDGDGLYHLSHLLPDLNARAYSTVITPHPGEMAMLLGVTIREVLQKPFQYAKDFAQTYSVYVVLKGRYTIITAPDGVQRLNPTGNAGLSKGGSGDVLTGIMLAMVMQKQSLLDALCNACFIHGMSADLLVQDQHSEHDLLASDVINGITRVYRAILSSG
ncbi:bifunctional ADP-dependent NAD(P)H-hydrate dehydratase/NAD(P)H-hydrate epimerase [Virgibacillus dokdonensis]|uniref:Bifunctional NAD(P)H-hydrate repair enzyme n=1 Tax=Virgibacillus dokdonensis TaxID=302167 RepID=A0A3E0WL29_9BACI|nr:NAD(P)H-hydrate dehydratase [Virgibacillus dokdonensis]RFA33662.1 bifunctional ADP-dependent NAD(P)H-hydrate dehydratase/NAD(P)H-hydrate epimerase [Virgibacillus dokdonensis]